MRTTTWVPQHHRIVVALRERIAGLGPGDRLPDAELCDEFVVSRMTAGNTMLRIVDKGVVRRVSGRGIFVMEPPANRYADRLMAFSHETERQGRAPHGPCSACWTAGVL